MSLELLGASRAVPVVWDTPLVLGLCEEAGVIYCFASRSQLVFFLFQLPQRIETCSAVSLIGWLVLFVSCEGECINSGGFKLKEIAFQQCIGLLLLPNRLFFSLSLIHVFCYFSDYLQIVFLKYFITLINYFIIFI